MPPAAAHWPVAATGGWAWQSAAETSAVHPAREQHAKTDTVRNAAGWKVLWTPPAQHTMSSPVGEGPARASDRGSIAALGRMAAAPIASLCIGRGRAALHKQQPTGLDFLSRSMRRLKRLLLDANASYLGRQGRPPSCLMAQSAASAPRKQRKAARRQGWDTRACREKGSDCMRAATGQRAGRSRVASVLQGLNLPLRCHAVVHSPAPQRAGPWALGP